MQQKKAVGFGIGFLVLLLLSGCYLWREGHPPVQSAAPSGRETVSGELVFWCWEQSMYAILPQLESFKKAYPHVTVKPVILTHDDTYKKLLLANAANEGAPDVAALSGYYVDQYIEAGALDDLTDWVGPYRDKIVESKWPDVIKNGRYYAMPWDTGPVGMYYRRDVFEKAGLPTDSEAVSKLVATWDDYEKVGRLIKERTGVPMHTLPLSTGVGANRLFEFILAQQGLLYLDAEGNLAVRRQETVDTIRRIVDLHKAGLMLDAEEATREWASIMNEGRVATVFGAPWMGGRIREVAPDSAGKWGVALMPAVTPGGARSAEAGGSYLGIPRQSKNKQAARAFIEFFVGNAETQNRIYRTSDIFPSLLEAYEDPMYDEPQPFFAGQHTRRLFVNLVRQAPPVYFSNDFRTMRDIANLEIYKTLYDKQTPEEAAARMEQAIREKTNRK
ncbi:ABC transporter substrate-binding protein [Paenibacillus sp. J31TS4]|uniref:ABC transporter substrate-binding protein n=1 Tax=Paenibacillus sp. J31TS4 TaxID=2807195 RepID=UPI001B2774C7|nr:sugar ABC transporter substrate-binding protein [Paenibacillus sp. J31TS4]GIP37174.1 ABC transporter substrate-binding protein [Paenibacillus sp. J31TS4]